MILHLGDLEIEMDDPFGVIYGLRSPSGKWYIGQTMQNINNYLHVVYICSKGGGRTKIRSSIEKYGFDLFDVFILHECNSIEELNKKEEETIVYYDSMNNGYNLTSGGDNKLYSQESKDKMSISRRRRATSEETCKKISESHKGKTKSESTCKKISENNKNHYKLSEEHRNNINWTGRHHSEESKQKISKSRLGTKMSDESKEKISNKLKGVKKSDEHKKNMSNSKKISSCKWVWEIQDPNGIIHTVININKFSKENGVYSTLIRLNLKGWRVLSKKPLTMKDNLNE